MRMYFDAREKSRTQGGTISSHFSSTSLSEYKQALAGYMRHLVCRNAPLYFFEDEVFHRFSRSKAHISTNSAVQTIHQLVELVERRVSEEMNLTRGALLFDRRT